MVSRTRGRPNKSGVSAIPDAVLLSLVLQAFGENGFDGTSIREIARQLNVSHNLIPQRFGTKKRLWFAAVDWGFGKLEEELVREGKSLGDDELVVLRGLFVKTIEIHAAHPALLQIVNQEASRPGPRLDYLFDTYLKPAREFGDQWMAKLVAEGRLKPTSGSLLYFLTIHGLGGLFALPALSERMADLDGDVRATSIREQAVLAAGIIFDGLLPR
ncbi:MAG: TetR/AcrR family transcriptional regulator [Patiriisocius sp.]|jgi:TetR/AcrR family transcriptional regulator